MLYLNKLLDSIERYIKVIEPKQVLYLNLRTKLLLHQSIVVEPKQVLYLNLDTITTISINKISHKNINLNDF